MAFEADWVGGLMGIVLLVEALIESLELFITISFGRSLLCFFIASMNYSII